MNLKSLFYSKKIEEKQKLINEMEIKKRKEVFAEKLRTVIRNFREGQV